MLWFVTEENEYYNSDRHEAQKLLVRDALKYNPNLNQEALMAGTETLLFMPSETDIKNEMNRRGKVNISNIAIVSPHSPSHFGFLPMGFFVEIVLRGIYYPYTKEQIALNIDKSEVISKRTGLKIVTPRTTLEDIAGAKFLIEDVKKMLLLESQGLYNISGLFFFGVAGSGKSYFGECFAGSTGRKFVMLDLPHFMSLPSPTRAVDEVFDFLLDQREAGERYLLLIDEIEKMFDFNGGSLVATQVFGKLLTRLNEVYSMPDSNITFVATANNISPILANNPEFLRKGRFNRLYFLGYPSLESAMQIFDIYKKKNRKKIEIAFRGQREKRNNQQLEKYFNAIDEGIISFDQLIDFIHFDFETEKVVTSINEVYSGKKQSGRDFIYVPPEIQAVAEDLQNEYVLYLLDEKANRITMENIINNKKVAIDDIYTFTANICQTIVPLQISAGEGIGKQLAQAQSFSSGENIQQFIKIN